MSNAIYKKDLHDIALAVAENSKAYADKKAEEILWKIGEYDITTQKDNTTALVKTAPSGATRVKIKRISGNCVKYAPNTASDDSVAKIKVIPENTYTTELNILGGMSYKSENLIALNDVAETTVNGVTYKIENGIVYLKGTWSGTASGVINLRYSLNISAGSYVISAFNNSTTLDGTYLRLTYEDGNPTDISLHIANNYASFTSTYEMRRLQLRMGTFTSDDWFIIKPMLVSGSTAPTEFKQGFEDIRDSAVTSVKSYGANLFDKDTYTYTNGKSLNDNGEVISNSSSWKTIEYYMPIQENTTYTLSGTAIGTSGWGTRIAFYDENYNQISQTRSSQIVASYTFTTPSGTKYWRYCWALITDISDWMLNVGSSAVSYKQYRGLIETKQIPAEVQALPGYGWGINDTCYNYIYYDTTRKKWFYVQNVSRIQIKDLTMNYNSNISVFYIYAPNKMQTKTSPLLLVNFTQVDKDYKYISNLEITGCGTAPTTSVNMKDLSCSSIAEFKAKYDNYFLYYELETPIETDISQYIDNNFIEVEENGTLVANNTYEQVVPSKIDYLVEEVKV